MSKIRSLSARETRRYMKHVVAYGAWCRKVNPTCTYEEACSLDGFALYDNLQETVDAWFMLSPGAFQAAWRKGFGASEGYEQLRIS